MRSGLRLAFGALAVCAVGACGSDVLRIDLSQSGDAVIGVALLDRDGRPRRALPLFGLRDGALEFGDRPQAALEGDEVEAAWIRLRAEDLEPTFPRAWPHRETFRLEPSPPPTSPRGLGVAAGARIRWSTALPEATELFGDQTGQLRDHLTLFLEQTAEPCRDPAREPLTAYASEAYPAGPPDNWRRMAGLVVLDADRALGGGNGLRLLRRGVAFEPAPAGTYLDPTEMGFPNSRVGDLRLEPRTRDDAELRFYALLARNTEGTHIVEVRLTGQRLEMVRTATVVSGWLASLSVSAAGEVAAVGDGALVVRSGPGGVDFRRHDLPSDPRRVNKARNITFTSNPEAPLIASAVAELHTLDSARDSWRTESLAAFGEATAYYGLARRAGELWLGGTEGTLLRRDPTGEWSQVDLRLPPRAGDCADGSSGWGTTERDITTLAEDADGLIFGLRGCRHLFRLRPHDRCISVIEPADGAELGPGHYERIRVFEDQIVVTDRLGGVFVSQRPEG